MKSALQFSVRLALVACTGVLFWRLSGMQLSGTANLLVIAGAPLLALPAVWLGRAILDRNPTVERVQWTTTFVQCAVGTCLGGAVIRAIVTHRTWLGWALPIPTAMSYWCTVVAGILLGLTVVNLALRGWGAPFFIVLSRRLAADWMYAWTRNPMVFAVIVFLVCLGAWFQSALFMLWVLLVFAPALLTFVKLYEERELELRFGVPYLEYKARTPMLFPRPPQK